jgi:hypothetical protein
VQRVILALIEADPHGAWTTEQLCRAVYPNARCGKKERVAVLRALKRMALPGTWGLVQLFRAGAEYCLCDPCDDESVLRADYAQSRSGDESYGDWKRKRASTGRFESLKQYAARERRWRDATLVERIEIRIAEIDGWIASEQELLDHDAKRKRLGYPPVRGEEAVIAAARLRIAELQAERARLEADKAKIPADLAVTEFP